MTARILRAATRPIKRLLLPLRLRYITWQIEQSTKEMARLRDMRVDLVDLERIESRNQAQLAMQRMSLERGWK